MRKVSFKGTEGIERAFWVPAGRSVESALEARGYSVSMVDPIHNPWREHDTLISVGGRLSEADQSHQIFLAADVETADLIWGAIKVSHPAAHAKRSNLERPA